MMNRELNIHLIEAECEKATKQEMEVRTYKAAELLAIGLSSTVVTTQVAEIYGLSRRQARRGPDRERWRNSYSRGRSVF